MLIPGMSEAGLEGFQVQKLIFVYEKSVFRIQKLLFTKEIKKSKNLS